MSATKELPRRRVVIRASLYGTVRCFPILVFGPLCKTDGRGAWAIYFDTVLRDYVVLGIRPAPDPIANDVQILGIECGRIPAIGRQEIGIEINHPFMG